MGTAGCKSNMSHVLDQPQDEEEEEGETDEEADPGDEFQYPEIEDDDIQRVTFKDLVEHAIDHKAEEDEFDIIYPLPAKQESKKKSFGFILLVLRILSIFRIFRRKKVADPNANDGNIMSNSITTIVYPPGFEEPTPKFTKINVDNLIKESFTYENKKRDKKKGFKRTVLAMLFLKRKKPKFNEERRLSFKCTAQCIGNIIVYRLREPQEDDTHPGVTDKGKLCFKNLGHLNHALMALQTKIKKDRDGMSEFGIADDREDEEDDARDLELRDRIREILNPQQQEEFEDDQENSKQLGSESPLFTKSKGPSKVGTPSQLMSLASSRRGSKSRLVPESGSRTPKNLASPNSSRPGSRVGSAKSRKSRGPSKRSSVAPSAINSRRGSAKFDPDRLSPQESPQMMRQSSQEIDAKLKDINSVLTATNDLSNTSPQQFKRNYGGANTERRSQRGRRRKRGISMRKDKSTRYLFRSIGVIFTVLKGWKVQGYCRKIKDQMVLIENVIREASKIEDIAEREILELEKPLKAALPQKKLPDQNVIDMMRSVIRVNPPKAVQLVVTSICILKGMNPEYLYSGVRKSIIAVDYWTPGKKLLCGNFTKELEAMKKPGNVTKIGLEEFNALIKSNPEFRRAKIKRAFTNAAFLYDWLLEIEKYGQIAIIVKEKEDLKLIASLTKAKANIQLQKLTRRLDEFQKLLKSGK